MMKTLRNKRTYAAEQQEKINKEEFLKTKQSFNTVRDERKIKSDYILTSKNDFQKSHMLYLNSSDKTPYLSTKKYKYHDNILKTNVDNEFDECLVKLIKISFFNHINYFRLILLRQSFVKRYVILLKLKNSSMM